MNEQNYILNMLQYCRPYGALRGVVAYIYHNAVPTELENLRGTVNQSNRGVW